MKIDDNKEKYSCFYDYPKKCYIDIFSPFMDYSLFAGNCKTIRSLENQKKYFTYFLINEKDYENTTRFGFPITTGENKFSLRTQNDVKHFNERVSRNIIDMDKYDNLKNVKKPEVILDFSEDKNGVININIEKNNILAEDRKKLGLKYKSKFVIENKNNKKAKNMKSIMNKRKEFENCNFKEMIVRKNTNFFPISATERNIQNSYFK
jgi:hypothetical protein